MGDTELVGEGDCEFDDESLCLLNKKYVLKNLIFLKILDLAVRLIKCRDIDPFYINQTKKII
jgi:hypothetical protein